MGTPVAAGISVLHPGQHELYIQPASSEPFSPFFLSQPASEASKKAWRRPVSRGLHESAVVAGGKVADNTRRRFTERHVGYWKEAQCEVAPSALKWSSCWKRLPMITGT